MPAVAIALIDLCRLGGELGPIPGFDDDRHFRSVDLDPVEALVLLADARRCRSPRLDNESRTCSGDQVAGAVNGCLMIMPGQQHVDTGIADRIKRKRAAPDRWCNAVADLESEQRVMGYKHPRRVRIGSFERRADEVHLLLADPSVLERKRSRRVDPENGRTRNFLQGTERVVDVPHVSSERRQEATQHVVERDVVVPGNGEHLVTRIAQPFEEAAGFLELLGARTLREVAADYDEIGPRLVDLALDGLDKPGIVGTEVQVGQMDQSRHCAPTRVTDDGSSIDVDKMNRTEANSGTRPVSDRLRFDEEALDGWMAANVDGFEGPIRISQFKGGQSNPTYRIDARSGAYVLRRKPPGKLLPGAHAVDREYRVLAALGAQGFAVPNVHALCEDESVIGTSFFIMDMVAGRIFWEAQLPGLSQEDRAAAFDSMNATIAALHNFDPAAIGLGDYGRPDGFVERQVARWSKQYAGDVEAGRMDAMDRLLDWLEKNLPPDSGRSSVAHGDFRCDNMIFDAGKPSVRAILDWELSTLGDPASDFTYHLLMYRMPKDLFAGLGGIELQPLGIPSEEEYVAAYCRRTGRDCLQNKDYLIVFNLFRLAAILHGIRGRIARGTASSPHAIETASKLEPLAELAWAEAKQARLE